MGNIVAYHHYLDSKEENTILHEAAQLNKELGQTQGQITHSWMAKYNRVCNTVNSPMRPMPLSSVLAENLPYTGKNNPKWPQQVM